MRTVVLTLLAFAALGYMFWRWRGGGGSGQFFLGILPAALLLVNAPIVPALQATARSLQSTRILGGDPSQMARICLGITTPLLAGTAALLVVMLSAGAFQILAVKRRALRRGPEAEAPRGRGTGVLLVAPLLAIPVLYLAFSAAGIARLLVFISGQSRPPAREVTLFVADRLLAGVYNSYAANWLLGPTAVLCVFLAASRRNRGPAGYGWAVFGMVFVAAGVLLVRLVVDWRAFTAALR